MSEPVPDRSGLYHPRDEAEVRTLVLRGAREGRTVRAVGSSHSWDDAVYTHPRPRDRRDGINLYLGRLRAVTFHGDAGRVTAQAGCNLGHNRRDPARLSTPENGLFPQLDARGLALPNTGGISHQTVGGFLSTGSAGGSLRHGVGSAIVGFRLVDGTGTVREVNRGDPEFDAVAVSMGLLGIVTAVTFQCMPRYDVVGSESICADESGDIDFFGDGGPGRIRLEAFFRQTEYSRLLWWPQKGVRRMVVWRGRRMEDADYTDETGPRDDFRSRPYHNFEAVLGSRTLAQKLASGIYHGMRHWNVHGWLGTAKRHLLARTLPPVMRQFLKLDGVRGPQRFWDSWHRALPMDNAAREEWLPTEFTELYIPVSRTAAVMRKLRAHYEAHGFAATGPYACEIYPTAQVPYWLGPAYERDAVKVDFFWFARNHGDPAHTYYPQFWELLREFEPRYHWGKIMPEEPQTLRLRYPRWDAFMRLRAAWDPGQVFVSDYWRRHLGIPSSLPPIAVSGASLREETV